VDLDIPIGVIGVGTMGSGIAQTFATHGFQVLLYDIDEGAIARGLSDF
jgi:3-hydroxybutyryl-CoA dehydrogenase